MPKMVLTKAGKHILDKLFLERIGIDPHINLLEMVDIPLLLELEATCFNPTYYNSLLTRATLLNFIGSANGVILVYREESRIAGYAQVTFRRNLGAGRFYSLAVHPDFQGKGAGAKLFQAVEKLCVAVGAPSVLLEIREDNHVLKARYEKLGYAVYRKVPDYYADHASALKMKKTHHA